MQKQETIYADGFIAKRFEKDPAFIISRLSIKKEEAIAFINKNASADGWVNLEIKKGKTADKFNVTLNTYKSESKKNFEPTDELDF
jgi:hypothetical protein